MQWPGFAHEAVGCFVLARRAAPAELVDADEGAGHLADVLWLDDATEGCAGITFSKALAFWRWVSRLPPSVTHAIKTEDDAVIALPNVMATLHAWRHVRMAYLGGFAHAGYSLNNLRMCGFDWQGDANFHRYHCDGYPPVPFAQGPLEMITTALARRLARDPAISSFVEHAQAWGGGGGRCEEDVLLGVWVSHLRQRYPHLNIAHLSVDLNDLADLHCGGNKNMLMSTPPRRHQLLVHRLKGFGATRYVWDVLTCQVDHTMEVCEKRACRGGGHSACAKDVR